MRLSPQIRLTLAGRQHKRGKKAAHKPGPASGYDMPELVETLRAIWMASDQLCSKRLKAALPQWLPHYETSFHPLSADTLAKLGSISAATIDRLLQPIRAKTGRRGLSGTKPGTLLKKHIPIQASVWDVTQPGFIVPGHLEQGRRWRDDANQGRSESAAVAGQGVRLR